MTIFRVDKFEVLLGKNIDFYLYCNLIRRLPHCQYIFFIDTYLLGNTCAAIHRIAFRRPVCATTW